jgi:ATP-dependent DNA helicase RecQ
MHIARQLVTMGYLKQGGEYHTLSLTARALEALKKRETIFGVVQEAERVRTKGRKKAEVEYNHALFALLRQKRKEMADEAGIPPYVIFSDRTLIEMCSYYPQSLESLLNISGVGQVKASQYGDAFLNVIKLYCEKHRIAEISHPRPREASRGEKGVESSSANGRGVRGNGELSERTRLVAEAFNEGATVQNLMERHQVTMGTILEHLMKYVMAGNALHNGADLQALISADPDQQQAAFTAFDELGPAYLKPVFDKLNGTLNYDQLKILRLMYLISQKHSVVE